MSGLINFFNLSGAASNQAGPWLSFLSQNAAKATLILLAAYALSLVQRRASAAARHLIWTSAILSLLALPALSLVLPAWKMPLASHLQLRASSRALAGEVKAAKVVAPDVQTGAERSQPEAAKPVPAPPRWPARLLWIWAAGLGAVLLRLMIGMARVWRSIRGSSPIVNSDWKDLLDKTRRGLGLRGPVTLLESDRATMPMAWGLLRPVILLPKHARQWSLERARIVLSHELAHVRRRDCLTQLLAQVACGLYWFHPLAWLAARQLRKERERACDDLVLNLGARPSDYAGHLLELARSLQSPSWSMAVPMAQPSSLESRMDALLDPRRNRRAVTRKGVVSIVLAAAALILPLAALQGSGEKQTGKIWGTVCDPSGAAIPGAMVTASTLDPRGARVAVLTNDAGEYEFPAIPAGTYHIDVRQLGFWQFQREGVVLKPNAEVRLDVVLEVGLATQVVTVTGKSHRTGPVAPPPPPRRIRVGGDVQAAKLISSSPKPEYPPDLEEKGIEGTVLLNAVIGMDGTVLDIRVINTPNPGLEKAALDAVKQWRYTPTLLNGEPVEVVTTITVNFRLVD
jgi:TonB family protein